MKAAARPTRAYHHGDLRNALLETALKLVAERGPEGFSLREAARELGVSAGAAYRHFEDKNALLAALAIDGHARLAAIMERALGRLAEPEGTAARAVAALVTIGECYVDFAVRHPSHFRVMFGPCIQGRGFELGPGPAGRNGYQILLDVLDGLVRAGAIPPERRPGAEVVAWSLVHGLAGLLVEGALELPARERAQAVRFSAATVLRGLGCDPALLAGAGPVEVDPRVECRRPGAR